MFLNTSYLLLPKMCLLVPLRIIPLWPIYQKAHPCSNQGPAPWEPSDHTPLPLKSMQNLNEFHPPSFSSPPDSLPSLCHTNSLPHISALHNLSPAYPCLVTLSQGQILFLLHLQYQYLLAPIRKRIPSQKIQRHIFLTSQIPLLLQHIHTNSSGQVLGEDNYCHLQKTVQTHLG